MQDYRPKLAPGELATVVCLACDREQASILFNYCKALCLEQPVIRASLECDPTADTITFSHRSQIKIAASNFRGTRGSTYAAALLDEIAFFRSEDSAVPDVEIIRALKPGLMTLGGALICLSSPYMKKGVLFNAHKKHFGNNASKALYVQGESITFNPTLNREAIGEAFEEDPEAAASEWGGLFRADLSNAFAGEWIDAAICSGLFVRERVATLPEGRPPQYFAFTDPAGGSGKDSWSTSIAHAQGERDLVQDALLEIRPPFSTTEAAKQVADFLKGYGLSSVQGDAYAGMWPSDALAANQITYVQSERVKSDIYRENVPLFSGGRVKILDNARQTTQLRNLERRVRAGGKDSFDHPGGANDDNANALCGSLLAASRSARAGSDSVVTIASRAMSGYADVESIRDRHLWEAGGRQW